MLVSRFPIASRARSVVGRTSSHFGATSRRPFAGPATTRTDGMLSSMPFDIDMDWSLEPPGIVARCVPPAKYANNGNTLHGGIAALLLDETMAALGQTLDKVFNVTGTLNLKYRRPIPLDGRPLRVEAWRDGAGRRATKVFGRIRTADGVVAVEAEGLFIRVNGL
jgi:acyl-coenzyme A thioesterase PaaI-like protein